MSDRRNDELTLRQRLILKPLAYAKAYTVWAAKRAAKKQTLWAALWSLLWDLAGFAAVATAGFALSSAAGWAVAGIGCFFMANRFRSSKDTGARL